MRPPLIAIVAAVVVIALASDRRPAAAALTSLIVIPTADVVGAGLYEGGPVVLGPFSETGRTEWGIVNEFGIGDRFEAGVDLNLSNEPDQMCLPNFKYIFAQTRSHLVKCALGYWDPAGVLGPYPFVVATVKLGRTSLHVGGVHGDVSTRPFAGVDHFPCDQIRLMADLIGGSENTWSAGFDYLPTQYLTVEFGVIYPNRRADPAYYSQLAVTWPY